jgi:N-acetylglucosamine kinase-like BadF-type ATPase
LYELVRARFGISLDLDLCSHIYGESGSVRRVFAQFALLVHDAAQAGDAQAVSIFDRAVKELVECVVAVRRSLAVLDGEVIPVSHSGGVFNGATFSRDAFHSALESANLGFQYRAPLHTPDVGAAIYAAQLAAQPLDDRAMQTLRQQCAT